MFKPQPDNQSNKLIVNQRLISRTSGQPKYTKSSNSGYYAQGRRQLYQFMPFALTLVFTISGQLLTSSRALMALSFAYICLCIQKNSAKDAIDT